MRLSWSKVSEGTMAAPRPELIGKERVPRVSNEEVIENRRNFVARCGFDPDQVTAMHLGKMGNDKVMHIQVIRENHHTLDPEKAAQSEAVIVKKPAVIFAVVGDCPAVALESRYHLALVHTGWRGTAGVPIDAKPSTGLRPGQSIVKSVIEQLRLRDGNKPAIRAAISPAICGHHYTVHEDVAHLFLDGSARYVKTAGEDEDGPLFCLDIPSIVRKQLMQAEVRSRHIQSFSICTFEQPDLYSDRGWKQGGQEWGRMGVLVTAE